MTASKKTTNEKENEVKKKEKEEEKRVKKCLKGEIAKEIATLGVGSIAMLASSYANQSMPRIIGKVLDQTKNDKSSTSAPPSSSMIMSVVLLGGFASLVRTIMLNRAEDNIASRLRTQAFESLFLTKDLEWFRTTKAVATTTTKKVKDDDNNGSDKSKDGPSPEDDDDVPGSNNIGMTAGVIGNIMNNDINEVAHGITSSVVNLLRSTSSCMYSTYNMLNLHPKLFVLSFCTVPFIGASAIVLRKITSKHAEKKRELDLQISSFTEERIQNIDIVKVSNREYSEIKNYTSLQKKSTDIGKKVSISKGIFMGFTFTIPSSAILMLVKLGSHAVEKKQLTSGQLTSFTTYSFLLALGASGISKAYSEIKNSITCAKRVYGIIHEDETEKLQVKQGKNLANDNQQSNNDNNNLNMENLESINLKNISFAYKTNPNNDILKDISLQIQSGQIVALVGKNGCGKTTLASLLGGLYQPTNGCVTLTTTTTTHAFNSLNRKNKKECVQIVPQRSPMMNMSIEDNLLYSNPSASSNELITVLKTMNCSHLIEKKDDGDADGINYNVGVGGNNLSQGEKQRLSLARALLVNPALLILDEPTSSLDDEGETAVLDMIRNYCQRESDVSKKSLLLITHRPRTLQVADIIYVMKDGRIIENGTYETLSNNKESELWKLMPELL